MYDSDWLNQVHWKLILMFENRSFCHRFGISRHTTPIEVEATVPASKITWHRLAIFWTDPPDRDKTWADALWFWLKSKWLWRPVSISSNEWYRIVPWQIACYEGTFHEMNAAGHRPCCIWKDGTDWPESLNRMFCLNGDDSCVPWSSAPWRPGRSRSSHRSSGDGCFRNLSR